MKVLSISRLIITSLLCQAFALTALHAAVPRRPLPNTAGLTPTLPPTGNNDVLQKRMSDLATKLNTLKENLSALSQQCLNLKIKLSTPQPSTTVTPSGKSPAQQIAELAAMDKASRIAKLETMQIPRLQRLLKNTTSDTAFQDLKNDILATITNKQKPQPSTPPLTTLPPTTPSTPITKDTTPPTLPTTPSITPPPPVTPSTPIIKSTPPPPPPSNKTLAQQIAELNAMDETTRAAMIEKMTPQRLATLQKNISPDVAFQKLKAEIDAKIASSAKPVPSTPSVKPKKPGGASIDPDELRAGAGKLKKTSGGIKASPKELLRDKFLAATPADRDALLEPLSISEIRELSYTVIRSMFPKDTVSDEVLDQQIKTPAQEALLAVLRAALAAKENATWKTLVEKIGECNEKLLTTGMSNILINLNSNIKWIFEQATLLTATHEIDATIDKMELDQQSLPNLLMATRAVINDTTKNMSLFMQALDKKIITTWLNQVAQIFQTGSDADQQKYLTAMINLLDEHRSNKVTDKVDFLPDPTKTLSDLFSKITDNKKAETLAQVGLNHTNMLSSKS